MSADEPLGLGDLAADRTLTVAEVRSALCSLLSLNPQEVLIVNDLEELLHPGAPPMHKVFCQITPLGGGDFPTRLSLRGAPFEQLPRIQSANELCRALRCRFLLSDDDVNPFTFLLVDGTNTPKPVAVEPERLDANEYVLSPAPGI